jgi:hypothetical protein
MYQTRSKTEYNRDLSNNDTRIEIEIKRRLAFQQDMKSKIDAEDKIKIIQQKQMKNLLDTRFKIEQEARFNQENIFQLDDQLDEQQLDEQQLDEQQLDEQQLDNDDEDDDDYTNRCVDCNCDMGPDNPRQLCGKTFCLYG